ncbi:BON domain-containing protein [Salinarimonas soli]|uniref:BON domain-containing protein n=1 Tax=Salinarimonas soli TaxID=1638099 RepID=A0A5B2VDI4_9HYPH|nr:BON domain-containing protein [Salinarimonas soli]
MADRKPNKGPDRDTNRYSGHARDEFARSSDEEGRDRYLGDSSGGYGTGGAAIDYHDVMGSGGYGAEGYANAYADLDPARVFERIDRGDVPSQRGRGPKGYQRSDERIREDVSERLTEDPHVDASDIEVSVQSREITLSGHVASRPEKRRAEDIAEAVSGVAHVQNNLRVRER